MTTIGVTVSKDMIQYLTSTCSYFKCLRSIYIESSSGENDRELGINIKMQEGRRTKEGQHWREARLVQSDDLEGLREDGV